MKFRNVAPNVNFFKISVALDTKLPAIVATEVFIKKDCPAAWPFEAELEEVKTFLSHASEHNGVLVGFNSKNSREEEEGKLNIVLRFKNYDDFNAFYNS